MITNLTTFKIKNISNFYNSTKSHSKLLVNSKFVSDYAIPTSRKDPYLFTSLLIWTLSIFAVLDTFSPEIINADYIYRVTAEDVRNFCSQSDVDCRTPKGLARAWNLLGRQEIHEEIFLSPFVKTTYMVCLAYFSHLILRFFFNF